MRTGEAQRADRADRTDPTDLSDPFDPFDPSARNGPDRDRLARGRGQATSHAPQPGQRCRMPKADSLPSGGWSPGGDAGEESRQSAF